MANKRVISRAPVPTRGLIAPTLQAQLDIRQNFPNTDGRVTLETRRNPMDRRRFIRLSSAGPAAAVSALAARPATAPLAGASSGLKISSVRLVRTRPRRPVPSFKPAPDAWSTGGVEVA